MAFGRNGRGGGGRGGGGRGGGGWRGRGGGGGFRPWRRGPVIVQSGYPYYVDYPGYVLVEREDEDDDWLLGYGAAAGEPTKFPVWFGPALAGAFFGLMLAGQATWSR